MVQKQARHGALAEIHPLVACTVFIVAAKVKSSDTTVLLQEWVLALCQLAAAAISSSRVSRLLQFM